MKTCTACHGTKRLPYSYDYITRKIGKQLLWTEKDIFGEIEHIGEVELP